MSIINFDFDYASRDSGIGSPVRQHGYPIIESPWPDGAYCPIDQTAEARSRSGGAMILWATYVGRCLSDHEKNGYDDSDFYMTVWNDETQSAKDVYYATTRAWTYPAMGSFVDATPETRANYSAWLERKAAEEVRQQRAAAAKALRDQRATLRAVAAKHGARYVSLLRLRRTLPANRFTAVLYLLTAALRSAFRISLRTQLVAWANDTASAHNSPFSPRQWDCVESVNDTSAYRRRW